MFVSWRHEADVTSVACDVADDYNYAEEILNELAQIADHFFFDKRRTAKDPRKMIREMLHADAIRHELKEEHHMKGDDADLVRHEVSWCFKRWAMNKQKFNSFLLAT